MSIRSALAIFAFVLVGCTGDAATPEEIDEVGPDQGTTRVVWIAGNGTEVVVYTPRVGPLIEHRATDGRGPVPDPWMGVEGPVPDPWVPPDPR